MAQDPQTPRPPRADLAVLLSLLCMALLPAAYGDLEDEEYTRLEAAYAALAGEAQAEAETPPDTDQARETLREALLDSVITRSDWHAFFERYHTSHPFAAEHTRFWSALIQEDETTAKAHSETSAVAAAEALGARAAQSPPDLDSLRVAIGWLAQMAAALPPLDLAAVGRIVQEALRGQAVDLEPLLTIAPETPPIAIATGIELAIVVSVFVEPEQVPQLLRLPASAQAFWNEQRMLLFDNGVLSPQHLASLASLLAAVPRELHGLYAILVPEAVGVAPANFTLVPATTAMMVEVLPMDLLTNPEEFVQRTGQPFAPQFTINAAMGLMQAIQFQQFGLRPELVHRRNLILSNAGFRNARYPRRYIDPSVYLQDPDSLLPLTSFLWFIDSSAAFNQMLQLFRLEQDQAMDIGLLLADTLSGGTGETRVFTTTPDGLVSSVSGVIRYTPVAPGINYATGIAVGGEVYSFNLGFHGSVETLDRY